MVLFENNPGLLLLFVSQIAIIVLNILVLIRYTNIHYRSSARASSAGFGSVGKIMSRTKKKSRRGK